MAHIPCNRLRSCKARKKWVTPIKTFSVGISVSPQLPVQRSEVSVASFSLLCLSVLLSAYYLPRVQDGSDHGEMLPQLLEELLGLHVIRKGGF